MQDTVHNVSILQPGSSVATALSEGESKKKHVAILELLKESYRTVYHELTTVRPFIFDQVGPGWGFNSTHQWQSSDFASSCDLYRLLSDTDT